MGNFYNRVFYVMYKDTLRVNNYFIPFELTIIHMSVLLSFYLNVILYFIVKDVALIINLYTMVLCLMFNFYYFFKSKRYLRIIEETKVNSKLFVYLTKVIFYISYFIPIIMYLITY